MTRKEIRRDTEEFFKSLGKGMYVSKDRVRDLIGDAHWLSDGEWKENILRSVLRQHLPSNYTTGKGFLVSDDAISSQIDILIYESEAPMLYRDGEFMIVQARFVKGVIEVKTKNDIDKFRKTTKTLCEGTRFRWLAPNFFRGIFLYDFPSCSLRKALTVLQKRYHEFNTLIHAVCCGPDNFIQYHASNPHGYDGKSYEKWHGYRKKDRSFGWFIASVVEAVNDDPNFDKALWGLSEIEKYRVAVQSSSLASDNGSREP